MNTKSVTSHLTEIYHDLLVHNIDPKGWVVNLSHEQYRRFVAECASVCCYPGAAGTTHFLGMTLNVRPSETSPYPALSTENEELNPLRLEVRAISLVDGECQWVSADAAEWFTLYVGRSGNFVALGDYDSQSDCLVAAKTIGDAWGIPWVDRIEDSR